MLVVKIKTTINAENRACIIVSEKQCIFAELEEADRNPGGGH